MDYTQSQEIINITDATDFIFFPKTCWVLWDEEKLGYMTFNNLKHLCGQTELNLLKCVCELGSCLIRGGAGALICVVCLWGLRDGGWSGPCDEAISAISSGDKRRESLLSQSGSWPFNSPSVCATLTRGSWHTRYSDSHAHTAAGDTEREQEAWLELAVCRGSEMRVMQGRKRCSRASWENLIRAN